MPVFILAEGWSSPLATSLVHLGIKYVSRIDGRELATEVLKRGQFSTVDLALVAVDERHLPRRLRFHHTTLCKQWPWPGEEVIVATPEATARSHVVSPDLLPSGLALKFWNAISDVATTGNSGSGVFDADRKCSLSIISGKIQETERKGGNRSVINDIAKFFVPACLDNCRVPTAGIPILIPSGMRRAVHIDLREESPLANRCVNFGLPKLAQMIQAASSPGPVTHYCCSLPIAVWGGFQEAPARASVWPERLWNELGRNV